MAATDPDPPVRYHNRSTRYGTSPNQHNTPSPHAVNLRGITLETTSGNLKISRRKASIIFVVVAVLLVNFTPILWFEKQAQAYIRSSLYDDLNSAAPPAPTTKRAFVCVTGLLERLELDNKISHLLTPLLEEGYELDISFILQNDTDFMKAVNDFTQSVQTGFFPPDREPYSFMHNFSGPELEYGWPETIPSEWTSPYNETEYKTAEQILRKIENEYGNRFGSVVKANVELYASIGSPPINFEQYHAFMFNDIDFLRRGQLRRDRFDRLTWRLTNHVRMLESYRRCGKRITAGVANIYVRVGEDAILENVINVSHIEKVVMKNGIQGPNGRVNQAIASVPCSTSRGHTNDQVDFISHKAAIAYFLLPYFLLYNSTGIFHERSVHNLPQFLRYSYAAANIEVFVSVQSGNWTVLPSSSQLNFSESHAINDLASSLKDSMPQHDQFVNGRMKYVSTQLSNMTETDHQFGDSNQKRALICMTGQLQRVELENKIHTLIKPMQSAGYRVDVALALSGGSSIWKKSPGSNFTPTFENEEQLLSLFNSYDLDVISDHGTFVSNRNMPLNPEFAVKKSHDMVFKGPKKPYTAIERKKLEMLLKGVLGNHLMTEGYTKCWKDVEKSQRKYMLYARARDDIGFLQPLEANTFETMKPHSIVVSSCRKNSGINDRFAFISPDSAECYFNLPFFRLMNGKRLPGSVINTESLFMRVYDQDDCAIPRERGDIVPFKMMSGSFLEYDLSNPLCP